MQSMRLDLTDIWGRPVDTELLIRRDTVELRCWGVVVGIANRDHLREWLAEGPGDRYTYDEMAWLRGEDGLSLAVKDLVPACLLTPVVADDLRAWV